MRANSRISVAALVHTFSMAEKAKIFTNGGSQAARLPKSVRFPKLQRNVIEPDEWTDEFLAAVGSWDEGIERPRQQPISKKRNPFD